MQRLATGPFKLVLCLAALLAVLSAGIAHADDLQLDPDQIKAILHTATDEEQGFVDRTVKMVTSGKLPRDIFTSCLIWARKKPRHKFQYFKQALTTRAEAAGIKL